MIWVVSSRQYISCRSLSRSPITQVFRSIVAVLHWISAYLYKQISLFMIMPLYNRAFCKNNVQKSRLVESRRRVEVDHSTKLSSNCAFRGAAAMPVDFSNFGTISQKKYWEPLDDPCVSVVLRRPFRLDNWSNLEIRLVRWWIASCNYPHISLSIAKWSLSST